MGSKITPFANVDNKISKYLYQQFLFCSFEKSKSFQDPCHQIYSYCCGDEGFRKKIIIQLNIKDCLPKFNYLL
jgi:hypothetical protein